MNKLNNKVKEIFEELCFYISKEIYTRTIFDISEITMQLSNLPTKVNSYAVYSYNIFKDGTVEDRRIDVSYTYFKEYFFDEVELDEGLQGRRFDFLIAHELGHYVHERYFNNKEFELPVEGMIKNSKINYKENFADAFADWLLNYNSPARNKAIEKILEYNDMLN